MGRQKSKEVHTLSEVVETNYRKSNKYMSYSKLSLFYKDKMAFYKKYILLEDISEEEEEKQELRKGTLVDLLLTEEDSIHEKIEIFTDSLPPPQMLQFCKFVYSEAKDDLTIANLKRAYERLKEWNDGTLLTGFEKYITNFSQDNVQKYYKILLSDKILISQKEFDFASNIVKNIKKSKRFEPKDPQNEIIRKHIINFQYKDVLFGAEIDELEIDHTKKEIYLYDYKTCTFIESFIWNNFLKYRYYIQASLYHYGLQDWVDKNLPGYKVHPMVFRVSDGANYLEPLVYETSEKQTKLGFGGFYVGNTYYKGIDELIDEYNISIEKDLWRISIQNFNNNGIVKIPEFTSPIEKNEG